MTIIANYKSALPIIQDKMNLTTKWMGGDNKGRFKMNHRRLGNKWAKQFDITYKYNELGYRFKTISELDDNYFITLGDSNTECIGIAQDDGWPYLLSNRLDLDVVNAGVGGSGHYMNFLAISHWLSNHPIKPKFVISLWNWLPRMMKWEDTESMSLLGSWESDPVYKQYMLMNPDQMLAFNTFYYNATRSLLQCVEIPYIDFTLKTIQTDTEARDLRHPGPEWHQQVCDYLLNDRNLYVRFQNNLDDLAASQIL